MKELTIKFSKNYKKLPPDANGQMARLLFVHPIELADQQLHFINYDTSAVDGSFYKLPSRGKYMVLLFELNGSIFTTIRPIRSRFIPDKLSYYQKNIGKTFRIKIEVENPCSK